MIRLTKIFLFFIIMNNIIQAMDEKVVSLEIVEDVIKEAVERELQKQMTPSFFSRFYNVVEKGNKVITICTGAALFFGVYFGWRYFINKPLQEHENNMQKMSDTRMEILDHKSDCILKKILELKNEAFDLGDEIQKISKKQEEYAKKEEIELEKLIDLFNVWQGLSASNEEFFDKMFATFTQEHKETLKEIMNEITMLRLQQEEALNNAKSKTKDIKQKIAQQEQTISELSKQLPINHNKEEASISASAATAKPVLQWAQQFSLTEK